MSFNIAIDGPAGAGKSTIAKAVAARRRAVYVDTGAMYRSIALFLLREEIDCDQESALEEALNHIQIEMKYDNGVQQMFLNGENVTGLIRTEQVSRMASLSSAKPCVRAFLLDMQRSIAERTDVIMDGRDIGTRILPDAQLKIFLTASCEARADRRFREMKEKGEAVSYEEILQDIRERDERDINRQEAPLRQAEDAVLIDSSDMTIEQVTERILNLAEQRS